MEAWNQLEQGNTHSAEDRSPHFLLPALSHTAHLDNTPWVLQVVAIDLMLIATRVLTSCPMLPPHLRDLLGPQALSYQRVV